MGSCLSQAHNKTELPIDKQVVISQDLKEALAKLFVVNVEDIITQEITIHSYNEGTKLLAFEVKSSHPTKNDPGYFTVDAGSDGGFFQSNKWIKAYNTQNNKTAFYVQGSSPYSFWKYDATKQVVEMAYVDGNSLTETLQGPDFVFITVDSGDYWTVSTSSVYVTFDPDTLQNTLPASATTVGDNEKFKFN